MIITAMHYVGGLSADPVIDRRDNVVRIQSASCATSPGAVNSLITK